MLRYPLSRSQHATILAIILLSLVGCSGGTQNFVVQRQGGIGQAPATTPATSPTPTPTPTPSPSPGTSPTPTPSPTPQVATQLSFLSSPSNVTALTTLANLQVALLDANGQIVTRSARAAGPAVTLTVSGNAHLVGTTTVNAVNGVATFNNVAVVGTGTHTLGASSGQLTAATSQPFTSSALAVDYSTRRDYPVTANPLQIVSADFNLDGFADFVTAPRSADNTPLYLGQSTGSFTAGTSITGLGAVLNLTAATGDFDKDGKPDLLVSASANFQVLFYKGNGDGTFASPVQVTADRASSIVVTDLNGDGKLDLVENDLANTVNAYLGDGTGGFTLSQSFGDAAGPINPNAVCVADFNGDNRPDLAYVDAGGTVSVALGRGDGTFNAPSSFGLTDPQGIVAGDVNGDGKIDLLVADNGTTSLAVLLGNGDGTFRVPVLYPLSASPAGLIAGDFNGDGRTDALVGHQSGTSLDVFFPQPDGTMVAQPPLPTGDTPFGINMATLADGPALLVANDGSNTASTIHINGDGTFRDATANAQLGASDGSVIGDINGDGKNDVVLFSNSSSTVTIRLGNNDGTFTNGTNVTASGSSVTQAALVDLNGDKKLDLLLQSNTGFQVCIGHGDGTFASPVAYGGTTVSFTFADFNGDGILDVALADLIGLKVVYLRGLGDGTFASPTTFSSNEPRFMCSGDVNADGKIDLIIGTASKVTLMLGNGDGTFQSETIISALQPSAIASGDLNHDGRIDAMFIDSGNTGLYTLISNSNNTFTQTLVNANVTGAVLSLTDINGDNILDALCQGNFGVGISTGNGDGTFGTMMVFGTTGISGVTAGNLNGDFKPDIIVNNGATSSLLLHL